MSQPQMAWIGEHALACTLPPPACLDSQRKLWAFADAAAALPEVAEAVAGMNNVTVFTRDNPPTDKLITQLQQLWYSVCPAEQSGRHIDIPVYYGGEYGADLHAVAAFHRTTPAEIVRRHTEPTYTVFMMGFQPGFPYLGGLPESLHTPRHAQPRKSVPAGSVGIGGSQTGMYPFASPGGWQLIGYTPAPLFQADRYPPTLLQAGDTVRFVAERIEA